MKAGPLAASDDPNAAVVKEKHQCPRWPPSIQALNAPKRYHDNPACPEGNKIEPKHKVSGTGGYQPCAQSARL